MVDYRPDANAARLSRRDLESRSAVRLRRTGAARGIDARGVQRCGGIDPATFTLEFANAVVQGADNAFELFGTQLPGATELENLLDQAETWSEQDIGAPYDQFVTTLNNDLNPFTAFAELEGPIGQDIENLLVATGIQQDILDPILGLFGPLGGLFTG